MYINQLLWYYHRLFSRNEDVYFENYNKLDWNNRLQEYSRLSPKGWDFINSKYHEAIHEYGIEISKDSFKDYIIKGLYNPYKKYNKKFNNSYLTRHEKSSHYIKKSEHNKKIITEEIQAKRDWIKKKDFKRSRMKIYSGKRSAGKYWKKISNSQHRNWQKNLIAQEKWDEMSELDYKIFIDPWLWD